MTARVMGATCSAMGKGYHAFSHHQISWYLRLGFLATFLVVSQSQGYTPQTVSSLAQFNQGIIVVTNATYAESSPVVPVTDQWCLVRNNGEPYASNQNISARPCQANNYIYGRQYNSDVWSVDGATLYLTPQFPADPSEINIRWCLEYAPNSGVLAAVGSFIVINPCRPNSMFQQWRYDDSLLMPLNVSGLYMQCNFRETCTLQPLASATNLTLLRSPDIQYTTTLQGMNSTGQPASGSAAIALSQEFTVAGRGQRWLQLSITIRDMADVQGIILQGPSSQLDITDMVDLETLVGDENPVARNFSLYFVTQLRDIITTNSIPTLIVTNKRELSAAGAATLTGALYQGVQNNPKSSSSFVIKTTADAAEEAVRVRPSGERASPGIGADNRLLRLTRKDFFSANVAAFLQSPVQLQTTDGQVDFESFWGIIVDVIDPAKPENTSQGATFFMAKDTNALPARCGEGMAYGGKINSLAVEMDVRKSDNVMDPDNNHIGLDVNGNMSSLATYTLSYLLLSHLTPTYVWAQAKNGYFSIYTSDTTQKPDQPAIGPMPLNVTDYLGGTVAYLGFTACCSSATCGGFYITEWSFESPTSGGASGKSSNKGAIIGGVVGGVVVLLAAAGILAFFLLRRGNDATTGTGTGGGSNGISWAASRTGSNVDVLLLPDGKVLHAGASRLPYHLLVEATDNFSEERRIGGGGFGSVYLGTFRAPSASTRSTPGNGQSLRDTSSSKVEVEQVAVKLLSSTSKQGEKEFLAEAQLFLRMRHRNMVQLRGWCIEDDKRLLVYEYAQGGSLDRAIFLPKGKTEFESGVMPWDQRVRVLIGVARALNYMHEEWEAHVVHRDVKTSNILLDASPTNPAVNGKLGDFGLARVTGHEELVPETRAAFTPGYAPPEAYTSHTPTAKWDVFAFGVTVLEVVSGRPAVSHTRGAEASLLLTVRKLYKTNRLLSVADDLLAGKFPQEELLRFLRVALVCTAPDEKQRPPMSEVVQMLTGRTAAPEPHLEDTDSAPLHQIMEDIGNSLRNSSAPSTWKSDDNSSWTAERTTDVSIAEEEDLDAAAAFTVLHPR